MPKTLTRLCHLVMYALNLSECVSCFGSALTSICSPPFVLCHQILVCFTFALMLLYSAHVIHFVYPNFSLVNYFVIYALLPYFHLLSCICWGPFFPKTFVYLSCLNNPISSSCHYIILSVISSLLSLSFVFNLGLTN